MELHSIDEKARLYIMTCGDCFSCYGFDVLNQKAINVYKWLESEYALGVSLKFPEIVGTEKHFNFCLMVLELGQAYYMRTNKKCPAELLPELIPYEGKKVEGSYYGERIKFRVGKSTGWMPCHLIIKGKQTYGEPVAPGTLTNLRVLP